MEQKKILLVEDDPFLQKLYLDLLTGAGLTVDTAGDGNIAFQKMKEGGWDLVLLDIMLPKLSGNDIMKRLKIERPKKENKKIVFLTNLDKGKETLELLTQADGYLIKSDLNPDQFINKVKTFL